MGQGKEWGGERGGKDEKGLKDMDKRGEGEEEQSAADTL